VTPPQQARSHKTLARILAAAEALIRERGVEQVTIAHIARRARSSVGAFYARFPDKEALVSAVLARFMDQALATTAHALDPSRWDGTPFADIVEAAVRFTLHILRDRRHLIAGLAQRVERDPQFGAAGERLWSAIADAVYNLARGRGVAITHPQPRAAVQFAVWTALGALHHRVLFRSQLADRVPDAVVARELTQMCLAYVGVAPGVRQPDTPPIAPSAQQPRPKRGTDRAQTPTQAEPPHPV
jgi:AcrR family transcriptional regulator